MTKEIQSTKLETSYNCTTRQVEFRISNFVLPSSFDLRTSSLMRPAIPPRPTLDPHVSFPAQAPSLVFGADRHRRDPHCVFSTPRRWRNARWPGESAQPATAGCTVKPPRFAAEPLAVAIPFATNHRGRGRESFPPTRFDRRKHSSRKRLPTPSVKCRRNGITSTPAVSLTCAPGSRENRYIE